MTIIHEDEMVLFYENVEEEAVYGMPVTSIGNVRMEGDAPCSDWVMQLVGKDWCPTEILYEFASLVKELGRDGEIDWYSTFQIVERKKYLDDANELRDAANPPSDGKMKTVNFDSLVEMLKFNAEDDREESQPIIDDIVNEKLVRYNLL